MHGKPVLMFFPQHDMEAKFGASNLITLRLAHFRGFFDCPGTNQCTDEAAMPDAVNALIAQSRDPAIREAVLAHARRYVVMDGPTYGERLAALVDELTGGRTPLAQAAQ